MVAVDIIACEHVLLQGNEAKSNLASVAGRLLERAGILLLVYSSAHLYSH